MLRRAAAFSGVVALVTVTVGWVAGAAAQPSVYSSADDDTSDLGAMTAHSAWIFNQIGDNLTGILVVLVGVGLWRALSHAAPELEALLPSTIDGDRLAKGSATGAVVLSGNNAFSHVLKGILARAGKTPADLTFANAQDPSLGVEVGAFRVLGLAAPALRNAIVRSTRPNAPGLAVSSGIVGGRRVTKVVYPGGATLYLYPHGDVVYYVGTQDAALAARILHRVG